MIKVPTVEQLINTPDLVYQIFEDFGVEIDNKKLSFAEATEFLRAFNIVMSDAIFKMATDRKEIIEIIKND